MTEQLQQLMPKNELVRIRNRADTKLKWVVYRGFHDGIDLFVVQAFDKGYPTRDILSLLVNRNSIQQYDPEKGIVVIGDDYSCLLTTEHDSPKYKGLVETLKEKGIWEELLRR